ncbi:hypothetical protein TBLA_0D02940 [Henningerozyma blattae CBS 6284]|uniref:Uncharacterized protein n=1 Tax=Henningerozyma blattae (strain ATCC 34711 / CBS 6284 / DSM 70876 / NBRC 10599 / NRRL Y-10934 / UCD 77-7) TaxID=1071380 RepID=I2H342_HENB6|nr:hypothetical protein TBLA_0D02940 [Tetrapisispora blattae CBS 6284]CCH60794.1 hypothetical protein TBLA_0D02940 [Tetrapisispora blattae CBS 6284]
MQALKQVVVRNSKSVLRDLPRVPTTEYLENTRLYNDIFFSGYRPVMYPVKENPLFRNGELKKKWEEQLRQD